MCRGYVVLYKAELIVVRKGVAEECSKVIS